MSEAKRFLCQLPQGAAQGVFLEASKEGQLRVPDQTVKNKAVL